MKVAKSYKIVLLLTAVVMSFAIAFSAMSVNNTKVVSASTYNVTSSFGGSAVSALTVADNMVTGTVKNNDTITIKNDLVVSDFGMDFYVPVNSTVDVKFVSQSKYINGNKNTDTEKFDKLIDNVVSVTTGTAGTAFSVKLNNGTAQTVVNGNNELINLLFKVDDSGKIAVSVNGVVFTDDRPYYMIENIGGFATADISFKFTMAEGTESGTFKIVSVDQKVGDTAHNYKQTFELNEDKALKKEAYPRVSLNDSFYRKDLETGKYDCIKLFGEKYNLSLTKRSLTDDTYASDLFITPAEGQTDKILLASNTDTPKSLRFKSIGDVSFNISKKDGENTVNYETFTANVVNKEDDVKAPEYKFDDIAYKGFLYQLNNGVVNTENSTPDHTAYKPLGTKLEVPSLRDLVYDDVTSYENLDVNLSLRTSKTEKTITTMSFKMEDAGNYMFFVMFTDDNGNKMETKDFVDVKSDNTLEYGKYGKTGTGAVGNFIFTFEIYDNANIEVEAPFSQGVGYKGVKFKSASFNIDAEGCNLEYKLQYNSDINATKDSEGWRNIPKSNSVDKGYNKDGFNYDQIKSFAYDGSLSFVPTEIGAYRIVCTATSEVTSRSDEAETIIKVESAPKTVKVDNHWLQNNVWSVVFLSVGTLCLIAIIVLLCIKPKDEKDKD